MYKKAGTISPANVPNIMPQMGITHTSHVSPKMNITPQINIRHVKPVKNNTNLRILIICRPPSQESLPELPTDYCDICR